MRPAARLIATGQKNLSYTRGKQRSGTVERMAATRQAALLTVAFVPILVVLVVNAAHGIGAHRYIWAALDVAFVVAMGTVSAALWWRTLRNRS